MDHLNSQNRNGKTIFSKLRGFVTGDMNNVMKKVLELSYIFSLEMDVKIEKEN